MKEIKFRWVFKNKETGEIKYSPCSILGLQNKGFDFYIELKWEFISQDLYVFTDKNGVDVYEGDEVKDVNDDNYTLELQTNLGGMVSHILKTPLENIVKIGTKYEKKDE